MKKSLFVATVSIFLALTMPSSFYAQSGQTHPLTPAERRRVASENATLERDNALLEKNLSLMEKNKELREKLKRLTSDEANLTAPAPDRNTGGESPNIEKHRTESPTQPKPVAENDTNSGPRTTTQPEAAAPRSEERRVGKECRSRWSSYH